MAERDLLLASIAPADYVKIQAQLVAISESPDEHTDDRPAETIPDWKEALSEWWRTGVDNPKSVAIEDSFKAGWVAAETRIEVLEAALVRLRDCDWVISLPDRMDAVRDIARAALAAPSGEKEKV